MNLTRIRVTFLAVLLAWLDGQPRARSRQGQTRVDRENRSSGCGVDSSECGKGAYADKAAAYYHFAMAHIYEEMVSMYGRADYANKAIDEYRLAIENDPTSDYLNAGLAELYARTGRIKDAVLEAQDILKRDGNNLEAHRLLGRIYLRSLGDMQSGTQSQEILKLAIEQYEQIVKLDPKSVEDHLLLGRLYRLNNDLVKAENEFKTAVQIQPDSEEAVTALSILYNEEGDSSRALDVLNAFPEAARTSKVYSALGYTYEQNKAYKKAIDAYQKSVDLDHDNLDSVRGLAQNLLNDGQTDAALAQFKVIVDADPSDAQTYMRMAEIYRRNGKYDEASDALNKASCHRSRVAGAEVQHRGDRRGAGQVRRRHRAAQPVVAEDRACQRRIRRLRKEQSRHLPGAAGHGLSRSQQAAAVHRHLPPDDSSWATTTRFAATRRSLRPTATRNSGRWPPTSRRRQPRSIPTTARCRWSRRHNALTWATRPRPSSR